jgi:hypothetical protein
VGDKIAVGHDGKLYFLSRLPLPSFLAPWSRL